MKKIILSLLLATSFASLSAQTEANTTITMDLQPVQELKIVELENGVELRVESVVQWDLVMVSEPDLTYIQSPFNPFRTEDNATEHWIAGSESEKEYMEPGSYTNSVKEGEKNKFIYRVYFNDKSSKVRFYLKPNKPTY